ncbi:MAG: lysophospholipid acyltransferase family protein [bacterium]|nr:lysophospholipid acyltransferase family protein [bacterium]
MRYQLEKTLLALTSALFCALPEKGALGLGRWLGMLIYHVIGSRRRLALENVRLAYGDELKAPERREIVRRSYGHLGLNIAEFFRLPTLPPRELLDRVTVEGEEKLRAALDQGRGVLLLSAHLGNWDYLSAAIAMKGYPLALITKVSRSDALNRIWMGYREKSGVRMLMGRGTMKESLKQLKKGGVVGFVLDQNARRKEGVFVPFFGRQACTLSSLAIIARRTGAPVVPVHIFRADGRHTVVFDEPIVTESHDNQEVDILERTAAYTRWTEKAIRRHPDQWTWLHDRWRTRPRP